MPLHLNVIDTIGVGTLGVVVQNAQNGITIGGKFIADDLIIRTSWLLPSIVVPVSMIIHVLAVMPETFLSLFLKLTIGG